MNGFPRTILDNPALPLRCITEAKHPLFCWFVNHLLIHVVHLNTPRPRQNGRHFADDTFNRIFVKENVRISIKFSLKFVPKGPINNIPALVQITAWRRLGDKPLSEPVMVSLLTHICVTRPQWVNMCCWDTVYYLLCVLVWECNVILWPLAVDFKHKGNLLTDIFASLGSGLLRKTHDKIR